MGRKAHRRLGPGRSSGPVSRTGGAEVGRAALGYTWRRSIIQTDIRREERFVLGWRYEELIRAGYPEREAMILADRTDVDLHRAVELLEHDCPPAIALRILL
jgi:hypothetical protein